MNVKESINEYLLEDEKKFPHQLIDKITFYLASKKGKIFADNQMMYFPWRLITQKLYKILLPYSKRDMIYFHPVIVHDINQDSMKYYLMHFIKKLDVLDKKKSVFVDNIPHKPIILEEKLKEIHVFNFKEPNTSAFCISEIVKKQFEKEGITGCFLQPMQYIRTV